MTCSVWRGAMRPAGAPVAQAAGDRAEAHWTRLTSREEVESLRSGLLRRVRAIQAKDAEP
jgi:hypothetical protein